MQRETGCFHVSPVLLRPVMFTSLKGTWSTVTSVMYSLSLFVQALYLSSLCSTHFLSVLDPVQFFCCASILTDSPAHSHFHTFPMVLGHPPCARSSVSSHTVALVCYHIILEMLLREPHFKFKSTNCPSLFFIM